MASGFNFSGGGESWVIQAVGVDFDVGGLHRGWSYALLVCFSGVGEARSGVEGHQNLSISWLLALGNWNVDEGASFALTKSHNHGPGN